MPENDVRNALGAVELFQGAPPATLERLATAAAPFNLAVGEYLFREGDAGDRIYLLASGGVEAIMRLPGGRELEAVEHLEPGVLIGEMSVLAARPRRFSVRAVQPSTGWSFDIGDMGRLGATEQPEVVRQFGRLALERLREQYERLAALCVDDSRAANPGRTTEREDGAQLTQAEREPGETTYLETVLFFSRFTPAELEELFGDLRRLEAPRDATLTSCLKHPVLLLVLRGAVETSIRRGGLAARARLAGPGRIVGHLNLLGEQTPDISLRARERSILLEVPLDRIARAIDAGDDTARRLGRAIYADVVDALVEAQRPIARMAAGG